MFPTAATEWSAIRRWFSSPYTSSTKKAGLRIRQVIRRRRHARKVTMQAIRLALTFAEDHASRSGTIRHHQACGQRSSSPRMLPNTSMPVTISDAPPACVRRATRASCNT